MTLLQTFYATLYELLAIIDAIVALVAEAFGIIGL